MKRSPIILLSFTVILLCCCNYSDNKQHSELNKFKDLIGDINYEYTSALLNQMDSTLLFYYSTLDLKESYISYIRDISNNAELNMHTCSSCERFKNYHFSGMESKHIIHSYDTIIHSKEWIITMSGEDTIRVRKCELFLEEEIEVQGPKNTPKYKNTSITWGLMPYALEVLNLSDTVMTQYIRRVREVGPPQPQALANGIIENHIDISSSYFRKLIVLREFYYPQLIEYGCVEKMLEPK